MADKRVDLPRFERLAQVRADSFNADDNTIEIVWTTGASVRRYDYWDGNEYDEVLSLDEAAVRLGRLNLGAPFLDTHCSYSLAMVIGSVVPGSARIEDGKGLCRILLSKADGVRDTVQKIREGVIRNISVGYWIHKVVKTEGERGTVARWDVVDWEPLEVSAVPIPADPGSQVRAERTAAQGAAKPELRSCLFVADPKQPARGPNARKEGSMKVRSNTPAPKSAGTRAGKAAAAMTDDEKRLATLEAATRAAERAGGQRASDDEDDEEKDKDADGERDEDEDKTKGQGGSDDERDGGEDDDDEREADDEDEEKKDDERAALASSTRGLTEAEVRKAAEAAVRADRVRGAKIREIGAQFGYPRLAEKHANGETSVRAFKDLVLERLATRQKQRGNTTFAAARTAGIGGDEAAPVPQSGTSYGRDMEKGATEARALLGLK